MHKDRTQKAELLLKHAVMAKDQDAEKVARGLLVESCMGLAIAIANKKLSRFKTCPVDRDAVVGEALLALCQASIRYDPERYSSFLPILNVYCGNAAIGEIRKQLFTKSGTATTYLEDMSFKEMAKIAIKKCGPGIVAMSEVKDELETWRLKVDKLAKRLDGRDRELLDDMLAGKSIKEIARQWNCSRQNVTQSMKKIILFIKSDGAMKLRRMPKRRTMDVLVCNDCGISVSPGEHWQIDQSIACNFCAESQSRRVDTVEIDTIYLHSLRRRCVEFGYDRR